jgi:hypothetical protein
VLGNGLRRPSVGPVQAADRPRRAEKVDFVHPRADT